MSLRARLLAAFAYTLLVVIVALEVPLGRNLSKRVDAEVKADAASQAQVVAAEAASLSLRRIGKLEGLVDRHAQELGGRVLIVNRSGRVLADSAAAAAPGTPYATDERPELTQALDGNISQGERHSDSLDQELLVTAVPVVQDGRPNGAVRVSQSVEDVNSAIRDDELALIGVGALALLLGLGVAWILAGSISRPIRALAAVARRMAGGDLDARAEPAGSREQVELGRAFNEMAERLGAVLESQRAFVADASHQLRTPLTGLRLRLEAAGERTRDPEVKHELVAAEAETERLAQLVDDLLTLAASERPPKPEPSDLGAAVAAAAERWREPARGSGHELRVAGGGAVTARAPTSDLAIVLDNLIENAIKYSTAESPIELGWEGHDGSAVLTVSNCGKPLGPDEGERAFERFYRGPQPGAGTGLGLAIVDALARRSGGRTTLRNQGDDGVVAEVSFPLAKRDFANP
jgi:signal transduction histidine kinase